MNGDTPAVAVLKGMVASVLAGEATPTPERIREVIEALRHTPICPGVDNVASLDLVPDCGEPSCGNICLGPAELIATAPHHINVVA